MRARGEEGTAEVGGVPVAQLREGCMEKCMQGPRKVGGWFAEDTSERRPFCSSRSAASRK